MPPRRTRNSRSTPVCLQHGPTFTPSIGKIQRKGRKVGRRQHAADTKREFLRCSEIHIHESAFDVEADFDVSRPGAMAELGKALAFDDRRNAQIVADVCRAIEDKRKYLVLTRRRDHLSELAKLMTEQGLDPVVMQGGTPKKELKAIRSKIADVGSNDSLLILTTVPYAGEGFDAPVLDTVFLAAPVSFSGILIQAVGRVLRLHPNKTSVIVHDYTDPSVRVLASQFNKRKPAYRQMGFTNARASVIA